MNIKQTLNAKLSFILLIIGPYVLDQSFQWITKWTGGFSLGFFGWEISHTPGFFLSQLYSASVELKSLYFFGIGFYLIGLFVLSYFVFLKKSLHAPTWMTLFLGGLLGYFLDGLTHSNIVYWFYLFGLPSNLSFVCMVIGGVGIGITFFKTIIQKKKPEARKQIFVMDDQYNFCISIGLTYIIYTVSMGCFSYVFISNLMNTQLNKSTMSHEIVHSFIAQSVSLYLFLFIILSSVLCVMFSVFIVQLSNRIYGPIYAFRRYIQEDLISKKSDRVFKLRTADHFKFLEKLAEELKNSHK